MNKSNTRNSNRRAEIERLLQPGAATNDYADMRQLDSKESDERWFTYALLSSISAAIRERAEDHRRSTERGGISSASEVSVVVRPAK